MEILSHWLGTLNEVPSHLKPSLNKLSNEHCSGISLKQLDSPMMRQYRTAKEEVPDALLFFRMGDFYELFGVDAIIASDICALTLTSRDKNSENPVPMAGTPAVAYKVALKKCLDSGFKVAVCDQVENPKDAKGLVRREITQIITPAVPGDLDDSISNKNAFGCYLACAILINKKYVFSYVDTSTAEFRFTNDLTLEELFQEIETIKPKELLIPSQFILSFKKMIENKDSDFLSQVTISNIENYFLKSQNHCEELFYEFFSQEIYEQSGIIQAEGALECISGILVYLKKAQKDNLKNLQKIQYYNSKNYLLIDESTRKHLDFFSISSGEKKGSLFHFLNHCYTSAGSRLLLRQLLYPYKNSTEILKSYEQMDDLISSPSLMSELACLLQSVIDLERILSKCAQKNIDPIGILGLRQTLFISFAISKLLKERIPNSSFSELFSMSFLQTFIDPLCKYLTCAFIDEIDHSFKMNQCIRPGFHKEWDEILNIENNFQKQIDHLEKTEKEKSQIQNLKIGYTRNFGYYFEISKGKLSQVPKHFIRKQTLTNGERFITKELKELEEKYLECSERRNELEIQILSEIRQKILSYGKSLSQLSESYAILDVQLNFSQLSISYGWVKPEITTDPIIELKNNVHPVLKELHFGKMDFIPNNISIGVSEKQNYGNIHLMTGPNMSGKSTLMRQVCVTQILCQIGCFVPASSAKIGLCDRILSRIGSSDYATKNQSTFMVEMLETAHLLRQATPNSLLILDEIGRGTSTYDGLSLAWAIIEELHDVTQARAFFSTHYHELVKVCELKHGIVPMKMSVFEDEIQNKIIFTRHYQPGFAEKSFGLFVAQKAGLSQKIIERAQQILSELENRQNAQDSQKHLFENLEKLQKSRKMPQKMRRSADDNTLF